LEIGKDLQLFSYIAIFQDGVQNVFVHFLNNIVFAINKSAHYPDFSNHFDVFFIKRQE
jgi:hypothetical protein